MDKELLILAYLERTLTTAQQAEFDRLLAEDVDFAQEVAFQRELKQAVVSQERQRIKASLISHEQRLIQPKRAVGIRLWIAGAAAILAVVGFAVWLSIRPQPTDDLYTAYYQPYPNTIMPVVRGESEASLKRSAFQAYDHADYRKADSLFLQLYAETTEPYALLYRGVSLLESGRYRDAIAVLEEYPQDGPLASYTVWYRALAHVKLNERKQAITLLQAIAEGSGSLHLPVQDLLHDLR